MIKLIRRFLAWLNEPVRTANYTPTEDDWWRAIK